MPEPDEPRNFRIERDDSPRVTPVNINTTPVGTPEDAGSDLPGDAAQLFGRRRTLTELDGVEVRTTKPYIEFDRRAKRFSGNSRCNRISGGFELDGASLRLSRIMSTKRACLDTEVQHTYWQVPVRRLEST